MSEFSAVGSRLEACTEHVTVRAADSAHGYPGQGTDGRESVIGPAAVNLGTKIKALSSFAFLFI